MKRFVCNLIGLILAMTICAYMTSCTKAKSHSFKIEFSIDGCPLSYNVKYYDGSSFVFNHIYSGDPTNPNFGDGKKQELLLYYHDKNFSQRGFAGPTYSYLPSSVVKSKMLMNCLPWDFAIRIYASQKLSKYKNGATFEVGGDDCTISIEHSLFAIVPEDALNKIENDDRGDYMFESGLAPSSTQQPDVLSGSVTLSHYERDVIHGDSFSGTFDLVIAVPFVVDGETVINKIHLENGSFVSELIQ